MLKKIPKKNWNVILAPDTMEFPEENCFSCLVLRFYIRDTYPKVSLSLNVRSRNFVIRRDTSLPQRRFIKATLKDIAFQPPKISYFSLRLLRSPLRTTQIVYTSRWDFLLRD